MVTRRKKYGTIIGTLIADAILNYTLWLLLTELPKLITATPIGILLPIFLVIAIVIVTYVLAYLAITYRKTNEIASMFAHLTVHRIKGSKEEYITNNESNKAFWVPDTLKPEIENHRVPIHTHKKTNDSTAYFTNYFKENNITLINRDPSPKELHLKYRKDKTFEVSAPTHESATITKLRGCKLEDLQIALIFSWYKNIIPIGEDETTNKRLLLKISTKQAYLPPQSDSEYWGESTIINYQRYAFRKPFESLASWCKRYGFNFNRRYFTEEELLNEIKNVNI